jgi:vacuolar-type H+-ATPase subunit B/Vma2
MPTLWVLEAVSPRLMTVEQALTPEAKHTSFSSMAYFKRVTLLVIRTKITINNSFVYNGYTQLGQLW